MRLFLAVHVCNIHIKSYVKCANKLENNSDLNINIKLIQNKNLHLTLHFLGETKENKISKLMTDLKSNVRKIKPFKIKLNGMGLLESSNSIALVALIEKDNKHLLSLFDKTKESIEKAITDIKPNSKSRSYLPHITLARIKKTKENKENIKELTKTKFEDQEDLGEIYMDVNEISLMQSVLKEEGAEYRVIDNIKL
jgi:RNA 2',3'-cyclic 3'-phosphodiesterase